MVICIFVLTSLFNTYTYDYAKKSYSAAAWYIAAVVVYFAYELITTKQFKNLVKALPGLGIVVAMNVAIFGLMVGIRSHELNYSPTALRTISPI
jgi:hypothetical protein